MKEQPMSKMKDWLAEWLAPYFVPREDFDEVQRDRDYWMRVASENEAAFRNAIETEPIGFNVEIVESAGEEKMVWAQKTRLVVEFYPFQVPPVALRGYIRGIADSIIFPIAQYLRNHPKTPSSIKSKIPANRLP